VAPSLTICGVTIAREEEKDEKEGIADVGLQYVSCFRMDRAVPGTGDQVDAC
jgi:hypothetical protein